jgi:hypothetical protein
MSNANIASIIVAVVVAGEESARADPKIVQTILHGMANCRRRARLQAIADLLKIPPGTVRSRYSRICASLIALRCWESTTE